MPGSPHFCYDTDMKRLFLASSGLTYIKQFVGSVPRKNRLLFIPTAANSDSDPWWIDKDRDILSKMGFQITEVDIAHADKPTQEQALAQADIVYIAGGNTFYLLQQLRDSGFGQLLIDFVNAGGLYAGVSAGALVAGTDIRPVETMDEPDKAPGLASTEALGFVSIVPIPHSNDKRVNALTSKYGKNYQLVYMTDDQAIVVEGDSWQIVESPMTQLEREWLENKKVS